MFDHYDSQNIFAKIIRQEMPCVKVYEDDSTIVFMDIMPQAKGHTLVVPKEEALDLLDLSADAARDLILKVQMVASAVKRAMDADGITIMQLNGSAAGQTVPHIHFHIIPGSILSARQHATTQTDPDQLELIAEKIRRELE